MPSGHGKNTTSFFAWLSLKGTLAKKRKKCKKGATGPRGRSCRESARTKRPSCDKPGLQCASFINCEPRINERTQRRMTCWIGRRSSSLQEASGVVGDLTWELTKEGLSSHPGILGVLSRQLSSNRILVHGKVQRFSLHLPNWKGQFSHSIPYGLHPIKSTRSSASTESTEVPLSKEATQR